MLAGQSVEISFRFSFKYMDAPLNHKANVKAIIKDKNGHTWEEYLPIVVNPSPLSNKIIIKRL